jgi:hypothetical protein
MARSSDIDQRSYVLSHGHRPRGRGSWLFESCDDSNVVVAVPMGAGHALYSVAVRSLPAGRWVALP